MWAIRGLTTTLKYGILILFLLNGCFGGTMFRIGPIPVKTGDIITKPITKSMVDKELKK